MLSQQEVIRLKGSLATLKSTWDSKFYEVFSYTQPWRNYVYRFKGATGPESQKQVNLYTNAGQFGTDMFISRLQNRMTPYGQPYFQIFPKESLDDDIKANITPFLEELSAAVNEKKDELRLDNMIQSAYYDLSAGSTILMRQNTNRGLAFCHIPLTDISLGCEKNQSVSRTFKIPQGRLGEIYPELAERAIQGLYVNEANKYEEKEFCDILYYDEGNKIYEYFLLMGDQIILKRQYKTSPFHIFHWSKAADMPFGNGVCQKVLPNIKRLNKYIKAKLEIIPFAFPMFFAKNGAIMDRNITYKPGAFIWCQNPNDIVPIKMNEGASTFQLEIANEEAQIKEGMLGITIPTQAQAGITATEIATRVNMSNEPFNANVTRLTEVLQDIGWDIVQDAFRSQLLGIVDFSFDELKSWCEIRINNDSQVDQNLIEKIQSYITFIGQFDPQAIYQSLSRGAVLSLLQKGYNLPVSIRRTAKEIDQAAQVESQAQAEQVQAQVETQAALDANKENSKAIAQAAAKGA